MMKKNLRRAWLALAIVSTLALSTMLAVPSLASHSGQTNFEAADGDLEPSDTSHVDWNSFAYAVDAEAEPLDLDDPVLDRIEDYGFDFLVDRNVVDPRTGTAAATKDDIYAGGVKQDRNCAPLTTGSPGNKNDLTRFYIAFEQAEVSRDSETHDDHVLYVAWQRVAQNSVSNSAHVAFEFNQKAVPCGSTHPLVHRTGGDMLIVYDFLGGDQPPSITLLRWQSGTAPWNNPCDVAQSAPCWGSSQVLADGADAAVNFGSAVVDLVPFSNLPDGGRTLGRVEFGEAVINLTQAGVLEPVGGNEPGGDCTYFGKAAAVSRTSGNSATAQLKDLLGPMSVQITDCPETYSVITIACNDQDGSLVETEVTHDPEGDPDPKTSLVAPGNGAGEDEELEEALEAAAVLCNYNCGARFPGLDPEQHMFLVDFDPEEED
jgi:hypothetical protein